MGMVQRGKWEIGGTTGEVCVGEISVVEYGGGDGDGTVGHFGSCGSGPGGVVAARVGRRVAGWCIVTS